MQLKKNGHKHWVLNVKRQQWARQSHSGNSTTILSDKDKKKGHKLVLKQLVQNTGKLNHWLLLFIKLSAPWREDKTLPVHLPYTFQPFLLPILQWLPRAIYFLPLPPTLTLSYSLSPFTVHLSWLQLASTSVMFRHSYSSFRPLKGYLKFHCFKRRRMER